ncbi:hypothetical protein CHELA20_11026 [Hyphomicrobiales bacterium]|nr:hypothetical protein CHELA20_11026 [Hyphomicrobiales bacterium]CAH1694672.1 hypothetical protein CHELA41_51257 [Hyphomicrobiales bacterium]
MADYACGVGRRPDMRRWNIPKSFASTSRVKRWLTLSQLIIASLRLARGPRNSSGRPHD